MNNNIKNLIDQAGISVNIETDHYQKAIDKWIDCFAEKLALLMVEECELIINNLIDKAQEPGGEPKDSWDRGFDAGVICGARCIHEHFRPAEFVEAYVESDYIPF